MTIKKDYRARKGSHISNEKAKRYGEALEKLVNKLNGKVTTEQIVESAKDEHSPLHDYFEWNDEKASIEYRKYQARKLQNSIVEVRIIGDEEVEIPSWVNVTFNKGESETTNQCYVTIDTALNNETLRKQYISKILEHLKNVEYFLRLLNEIQ